MRAFLTSLYTCTGIVNVGKSRLEMQRLKEQDLEKNIKVGEKVVRGKKTSGQEC